MVHQVASIQVLHYKEQIFIGLERAEQLAQKWALSRENQHFSLNECALGVIIFQNDVLFQAFHGEKLAAAF